MHGLPIITKKYLPEGLSGANVTFAYWYEPQEGDILTRKGGIGLLISLMGPDEFSGERATKFMWDSFNEAYYYSDGAPTELLRDALKASQKRLVELIQNENGVSEQGVDVHMCAFSVQGESISLSLVGSPDVVLFRSGEIVTISDVLPSYKGDGYRDDVSVGTFGLKKGDIFLLSTPKLLSSFLGVFGEKSSEILSSWDKLDRELSLYAENMAGNQFMWLVGYDVAAGEDTEMPADVKVYGKDLAEDVAAEAAVDAAKTEDEEVAGMTESCESPEDSGQKIISGEEAGGEEESVKSETYTPGGIMGKVKEIWHTSLRPRIESLRLKDRYQSIRAKVRNRDISSLKRSIGSSVSRWKLRGSVQQKITIGQQGSSFSRFMRSKGIIILAILAITILCGYYLWRRDKETKRQEEIESAISEAVQMAEDAGAVWDTSKNREEVTQEVLGATAILDNLAESDLTQEQREQCDVARDNIQQVYDEMDRVSPLSEDLGTIEILTDLYLKIGDKADVRDFEKYGDALYLTDVTSHAVYRYAPGGDVVEKIANSGEVMIKPTYIAISDGYMFVYDEVVGIVTLDMNEEEPNWSFKIRPELSARTVGNITEIGAFAENVYILKRDEARVLKSYPAGVGYSYPEVYFQHGGFDKAVDLLIDGNIYVLSNANEKLFKYFGGQQDNFAITGLNVPLGLVTDGATNLNDTSKLFVYDSENKRIVAIEKPTADRHPGEGVFVRQYVYRGERDDIFNDVKEMVVDVDECILYMLDGTRVLKILLENE